MNPTISSYEITSTKSLHKIPIINSIHLHSTYNPIDEAKQFVSAFDDQLKKKKFVLILGLGFGYHVHEIIKRLKNYHNKDYYIWVLEPLNEMARDCKLYNPIYDENLQIITYGNIDEYYNDISFVDFLLKSPLIISHPASMQINENFFKLFFQYKATDKISDIINDINDFEFKNYLTQFPLSEELESIIKKIKNKKEPLTKFDFLLLAYEQI